MSSTDIDQLMPFLVAGCIISKFNRIMLSANIVYAFMLISPKDKQGFLRDLAPNAGDFEQSDDGIVRMA